MSVSRSGFPGDPSWNGASGGSFPTYPAAPDCDHHPGFERGGQPSPIDVLIGGFSVWLTRQDVTPARRDVYLAHAERFLCWQAGGPDSHPDRTPSRYTSLLRRRGQVSDAHLAKTALSLLGCYRVTAPRGLGSPDHNPQRQAEPATAEPAIAGGTIRPLGTARRARPDSSRRGVSQTSGATPRGAGDDRHPPDERVEVAADGAPRSPASREQIKRLHTHWTDSPIRPRRDN
jgi:hypothetical protein